MIYYKYFTNINNVLLYKFNPYSFKTLLILVKYLLPPMPERHDMEIRRDTIFILYIRDAMPTTGGGLPPPVVDGSVCVGALPTGALAPVGSER